MTVIVLVSPQSRRITLSFLLYFSCSNNQAKYEVLILGLQIHRDMQAMAITIYGDSLLILNQISREYKYEHESLI